MRSNHRRQRSDPAIPRALLARIHEYAFMKVSEQHVGIPDRGALDKNKGENQAPYPPSRAFRFVRGQPRLTVDCSRISAARTWSILAGARKRVQNWHRGDYFFLVGGTDS
jgi:hypothetical protein